MYVLNNSTAPRSGAQMYVARIMEKVPVCHTCNKELARAHIGYEILMQHGVTSKDALDMLHMNKMCCRTNIIASLDLFDDPSNYIYVPASVELRVANGTVHTDPTVAARTKQGITHRKEPICIRPL